MNSHKRLQTAAIFFSDELLSETGYWLGVCHDWFHLHRLPLAARSGIEIYKMKNSSCPQRDSNSRPSDWEAIALSTRPRRQGLGPPTWDLLRLNLGLKLTNSASPEISQIWCATNLNLTQLTWDFIWVEIWDFSPLPSWLFSLIFTLLIPRKQVNAFKLDINIFLWQFSLKQNRSTEGCSKLKRSVDMTSSGKNGLNIRTNASPKWDSRETWQISFHLHNTQRQRPSKFST